MDDVVLIHNDPVELQSMLDITHAVASKYRIKFGKEKSKSMIIQGSTKNTDTPDKAVFKIGNQVLDEASTYKYLGITLNNTATMTDHIENIKNKAEVSLQTIINVASNEDMRPLQMETMWKLYKGCTIPIMTYGAESWIPLKPEIAELQKKHNSMLKRILQVPQSTPDIAISIETCLPTIQQIIEEQQLNYYKKQVVNETTDHTIKTPWETLMKTRMKRNNITHENLTQSKKFKVKQMIAVAHTKERNIKAKGMSKSKEMNINNEKWTRMPWYMYKQSREQVSAIFKLRSRMLKIKGNYPNMHTTKECRWCKAPNESFETQAHILLECKEFKSITQKLNL